MLLYMCKLAATDIWYVAIFGDDQTSPQDPVAKGKVSEGNKINIISYMVSHALATVCYGTMQ